ncbi:hypothetical protein C8J57DRAFT_1088249 [Mycena rebaudengoi]|nr:hypothetical protein C8J57DRAFT_1088249 [Mycena rebaudengoi]
MDFDLDDEDPPVNGDVFSTVDLPPRFILVKHHPHAEKANEIIPFDSSTSTSVAPTLAHTPVPVTPDDRPWAPFKSYADYKFTSRQVRRRTPNAEIDKDLNDLHNHAFSSDCFISFRNHRDMEKSLAAARTSNISVISHLFFGGTYEVEIEFRDPWQIIKQWVRDESLTAVSTWFSQEKYLCMKGTMDLSNQLYDEPCTGENWKSVDDSLPSDDVYPSCFLGLHVWLDKGLVSTKVKMHPILLRGCWIHSTTRNGLGNGGSTLAGFVKMPPSLRQVDPNTLSGSNRSEYDRLKRMIYRGVCHLVMESLEQRSHHGEALRFSDGVTRIAYPGVLIESMDFEELAAWLGIRNSRSNHPCPQCLVHKDDLPRLTRTFEERTTQSMSRVLARAPAGKTARDEYLKNYGLHGFEHFLWKFQNSDPYKAAAYDCLHFFDGGIWGRHIWPLIKLYLQNEGLASQFNANMANFPRWRDLKHLPSPTTIDYSDGQTFLDILKDVSETHDKNFKFLKQHFLSHAIKCFKAKGTSRNQNTRVGEGFQQEVSAQYLKTNGKDAEHQMSIMDENEETMAQLDMKVDEWRKSREEDDADPILPSPTMAHWKLGSADTQISSIRIETDNRSNPFFRDFNMKLREYLANHHPNYPVSDGEDIQIEACKVLYVEFQSQVDWNIGRDILRCNPEFHGRRRYDSVIYEAHGDDLAMGQLELVFHCHLPCKVTLDLAMIQPYRKSTWAAKTHTDCPMHEWTSSCIFIALQHVTCGALLCPIFGAPREIFYVIDCVDEDMFLRVNNIE